MCGIVGGVGNIDTINVKNLNLFKSIEVPTIKAYGLRKYSPGQSKVIYNRYK